ncbi:DUF2752 domain-containing protein [Mucilaginibacter boryungensis]|uniref:DUF2752 domain-containing protein n=1 Tax=Mucilaginibacter boryungensis TaxID=768480 RepID=UPI00293BD2BF|nr:DUF2752 domain-containing protein [Mucilaginibacter boryungensis]
MLKFIKTNFELLFWIAALIALAFSDPAQPHFVLCPFRRMGITWCPGCGIGHAISYLFRGNISASFHAHWFGIPVLGVLLWRVYTLALNQYRTYYHPPFQ